MNTAFTRGRSLSAAWVNLFRELHNKGTAVPLQRLPVCELLRLNMRGRPMKHALFARAPINLGAFAGELEPIVVGRPAVRRTATSVMSRSMGISQPGYLLVAALAEDLNGIEEPETLVWS